MLSFVYEMMPPHKDSHLRVFSLIKNSNSSLKRDLKVRSCMMLPIVNNDIFTVD